MLPGSLYSEYCQYACLTRDQEAGLDRFAGGTAQRVTAGESVLRSAHAGDAVALAELDSMVNPSPWTSAQFSPACEGTGNESIFLLEEQGQLLGFVVYSVVLDEACIHNIAVQPKRQRDGMGRQLLLAALAAVTREGASRCYLEVRISNVAARGLYEKYGFSKAGLRKNYYPKATGREDALLLSCQL